MIFEIEKVDFDQVLEDLKKEGIDTSKSLLKEEHCLDKIADLLNNKLLL